MLFHVIVDVDLRPGIADPSGATIERALGALGYGSARDVRVGKTISFTLDAADESAARAEVDQMCERLLTNPVIESSSVRLTPKAN